MADLVERVLMLALAFGAIFTVWMLDACMDVAAIICRRFRMHPRDVSYIGGALFMFLMFGVPVLAVAWGFVTGRLPAAPA